MCVEDLEKRRLYQREYQATLRAEQRDKIKAYQKEYRAKNREKISQYQKAYRAKNKALSTAA